MIRSITLRLEGNNGVHLDEVKLVTHMGMEFLWLFSSPSLAHGGWLDGDNSNDDILPAQTLSIADASARLPTDATPTVRLSVGTVTSMQSGGSADGSRVSRHDIAGIWVAFFQECQQYRCGQDRGSGWHRQLGGQGSTLPAAHGQGVGGYVEQATEGCRNDLNLYLLAQKPRADGLNAAFDSHPCTL